MSAEEKNKLDELFKSGLDVPDTHFEYSDQDWDDFEHLMGGRKRPRVIAFWLPVLSGVAALLLLVFGWWFFKPAKLETQQVAVVKHTVTPSTQTTTGDHTADNSVNKTDAIATKGDNTIPAAQAGQEPVKQPIVKQQVTPVYAVVPHKQKAPVAYTPTTGYPVVAPPKQQVKEELAVAVQPDKTTIGVKPTTAAANTQVTTVPPANANATSQEVIAKVPVDEQAAPIASAEKSKKIKAAITGHAGPKFGLAMLLSPDINGAGSFQNAKVGTNIGLQFSVSIKKLTITTGASYSKKPYMTNFDNYYTSYKFKTDPQDVVADCRVLDIPLNIDYQVYHKSKNSFSVGTGLSSYIMLRETYNYDYAVPGTPGPTSITFINRHQHILGVLNLNATYAHQLNNKFSIAAQPYLKIPLTDIGNSQVRLQSAGVAVGLRWNINQ